MHSPTVVNIPISAQVILEADLYRADRDSSRLAIICHGFTAFRKYLFLPTLAERIASSGIHALIIDFSRNGMNSETGEFIDPEGFSRNTFENERQELVSAVKYFLEQGVPEAKIPSFPEILLLGHSRGGVTVLGAAADPELAGKISKLSVWSAPSDIYPERFGADDETKKLWREHGQIPYEIERLGIEVPLSVEVLEEMEQEPERIERFTKQLECPLLVVHGEKDERIDIECGRKIAGWGKHGELCEIQNADHVFSVERPMKKESAQLQEAIDAVIKFFD